MLTEVLLMATTVWYVPGWLRTQEMQTGVEAALTNAYPSASVSFWSWNGDAPWGDAVTAADKEAARLARDIAALSDAERADLVLVGHSLGGRLVAHAIAQLAAQGKRVREAVLLAAAIPQADEDLAKMGAASREPVLAICNPRDVTLKYVYATFGGETTGAFGAGGSLAALSNVVERATPKDVTTRVAIDQLWAKSQTLKDIANHHALFYLGELARLKKGGCPSDEVLVPQEFLTIPHKVMDAGVWWDDVEATPRGWKLERNRLTHHFRILTPERVCVAWGSGPFMRQAFAKVAKAEAGE